MELVDLLMSTPLVVETSSALEVFWFEGDAYRIEIRAVQHK